MKVIIPIKVATDAALSLNRDRRSGDPRVSVDTMQVLVKKMITNVLARADFDYLPKANAVKVTGIYFSRSLSHRLAMHDQFDCCFTLVCSVPKPCACLRRNKRPNQYELCIAADRYMPFFFKNNSLVFEKKRVTA